MVSNVPNMYGGYSQKNNANFENDMNHNASMPGVKITKMDETYYFKDLNNQTITSSLAGKFSTPRNPCETMNSC
jgi:hypothetical protein